MYLRKKITTIGEKLLKVLDKHTPLKRKQSRQIMRHVFLNLKFTLKTAQKNH